MTNADTLLTRAMAKHVRDVHFGGNWTAVNLKDALADVTWQQATTRLDAFCLDEEATR